MVDLSNTKAGDAVWVAWRCGYPKQEVVTKVTATRIIIDRRQFLKKNGEEYGGSKWTYYAIITDAEAQRRICRIDAENNRAEVSRTLGSWTLSQHSITAMRAAADAAQAWLRERGEWSETRNG